jgi:RHS repeat-associated protein
MNAYTGLDVENNTFTPVSTGEYKERVRYDENGNIDYYLRNGAAGNLSMDSLFYSYKLGKNQLDRVSDEAVSSYADDLKGGQTVGNYQYDAVGNLIQDRSEELFDENDLDKPMIEWNVYGKISRITKKAVSGTTIIDYVYDVSGNRIRKAINKGGNTAETWYVRDAMGNTLSIYEKKEEHNNGYLAQTELYLYGGGRLGIWRADRDVEHSPQWSSYQKQIMKMGVASLYLKEEYERGNQHYELKNHLSNVLVTVTDRNLQIFDIISHQVPAGVSGYSADVLSANDYYPFGMRMPERHEGSYRYGFNGKEQDPEVKGNGAQYDYGFRIYDPRIAKFLSIDPLFKTYPYYTPYQFASNSPIIAIDVDGLESSNDKNPTQQPLSVPPATPGSNPNEVKKYDASTWALPFTKIVPSGGVVEHSHAATINEIYAKTGGDATYNVSKGTIDFMNNSLTPVRPGSIVQNPASPQAVTNVNTAFYSGAEVGSEKAWVNLMLGGMIKGTVPENIVFSENGTVSNYLIGSPIYEDLLRQWDRNGRPSMDNTPLGYDYGMGAQVSDIVNNFSLYSMSNFVGSATGTVLANPSDNTITLTITNVTSVHSGDLMKHMWWHDDSPPFLYRDPSNNGAQPYTNFSQTYRLKLNYSNIIRKIDVDNAAREAGPPRPRE